MELNSFDDVEAEHFDAGGVREKEQTSKVWWSFQSAQIADCRYAALICNPQGGRGTDHHLAISHSQHNANAACRHANLERRQCTDCVHLMLFIRNVESLKGLDGGKCMRSNWNLRTHAEDKSAKGSNDITLHCKSA